MGPKLRLERLNKGRVLREQARALVPALRERRGETAALGRLPDATLAELKVAEFFKILQPARYGGLEMEPMDFFDVQMILAEGCMSTAWVLGVVAIHNWQLALFDDRAQRDVWGGDDSALISSSYMPVGKVRRADGGYRLSGHWGFSSGSLHCQWAFLGAMVPPETEGQPPDYRTFLVPRSDYTILENWDVSGLEGTGSHDIVVEGVFVPEHRTHRALDGFNCDSPGNAVNVSPLYRIPFGQIFVRAVCSSSIGALQGALDAYLDVNRERVGLNDRQRVILDPNTQLAAARAVAAIDECKTILARDFNRMLAATADGGMGNEERSRLRFNASLVADKCCAAINELFLGCGAQAIFRPHPVNRAWLDINAGRTHVANNLHKFGRNLGGELMGIENQDTFM